MTSLLILGGLDLLLAVLTFGSTDKRQQAKFKWLRQEVKEAYSLNHDDRMFLAYWTSREIHYELNS